MIVETKTVCPSCRQPIESNAPLGLCPACLIKSGAERPAADGTDCGSAAAFCPAAAEEMGCCFPQLEVLHLIGKGGMGAVYKARQRHLDRFVALKVLPLHVTAEPAFAERFEREAKALARLNHPNIVAIYDSGQQEGFYYFLMEYVDGVNLRERERSRRPSPEEALAMVSPLCEALQYAHQQGVIHRDIKPENILIDQQGHVKIADFGLAKLVDRGPAAATLTGAGQVMGTPHYMAPEQLERPGAVDHRADIYSLGVVLYELLTGELPLGKFARPSEKAALDPRLDEVVMRALEKEPARRYQHVAEIKRQVETIASRPCGRTQNGPVRRVWKDGLEQARKAPVAVAVLLASLLLVGLFALDLNSGRKAGSKSSRTAATALPAVAGWQLVGKDVGQYSMGLDQQVRFGEQPSICLRSVAVQPDGFGTLLRISQAEPLRGKRLWLSAYVKAEAVTKGAGIWLRADAANGEAVASSNMQSLPIKGTQDWARQELTLDIPETAAQLAFGLQLVGPGKVWLSEVKSEVIPSGATSTQTQRSPSAVEIRGVTVEEWLNRLGRDAELGYALFGVMNALITKAKEGEQVRDEILKGAAETIDDPAQNLLKRWQACYVLSGIGDTRGIAPVSRALKDPSSVVRGVAACALGAFDHPDAKAALERGLANEPDRNVQETIRKALQGQYRKPTNSQ